MESAMFPGCCLAAVLVLVALASPHRLAAAAAAAGEGSETNWHVVSVNSLLPNPVCTTTKGPGSLLPSYALVPCVFTCGYFISRNATRHTIVSLFAGTQIFCSLDGHRVSRCHRAISFSDLEGPFVGTV